MDEKKLGPLLKRAYRAEEQPVPGFEETWRAARARHRGGKYRRAVAGAVAAAAAVAALSFGLRVPDEAAEPEAYVTLAAITGSTRWVAPSDVLLPERAIDLYSGLPALMESTEPE